MTERVHRHLDGELSADRLSPPERERAAALSRALDAAAAELRAVRAPDLADRVMAALPAREPRRQSPLGALRRALAWLWNPTPVTFRPAYGFAAALAAVLAFALWPQGTPRQGIAPPVVVQPSSAPPVYVQFRLEAEGASSVRLAGTFTGWKPEHELRETAPGEWTVLVPLRPGVHDYAFVIDGDRWVADPHAPQVDDDFGGSNSRISLPALGRT